MRTLSLWTVFLILLTACTAGALEIADKFPMKSGSFSQPIVYDGNRVGGDTVDDAVAISMLPYNDTGSTCQFVDNYDSPCYTESNSPDVVYSFAPAADVVVDLDLCGSLYDTKVFVLDVNLDVVGCSDDYYYDSGDPCGQWVSKLEFLPLAGGMTYYIIVDGYGGECGDYVLTVSETAPCPLDCPGDALAEGEPPLADGYDDIYNGGCGADSANPLDSIVSILGQGENHVIICGSGGYWGNHPSFPDFPYYWDDDWYAVTAQSGLDVTVTLEAQRKMILHEINLPGGDCSAGTYLQSVFVQPCQPTTITAMGNPSHPLIFWVQSIFQVYPDYEFPYILTFDGIVDDPVSIEATTWSQVKCIFR